MKVYTKKMFFSVVVHKFKYISFLLILNVLLFNFQLPVNLHGQDSGIFYFKRALEKYNDWDTEGAIFDLKMALQTGLNKQYQVEAFRILARWYVESNHHDKAVDAFRNLLKIKPDFRLKKDRSPTIKQAFEEAKKFFKSSNNSVNSFDYEPPTLISHTEKIAYEGKPFRVRAKIEDNDKISRVLIVYKSGNDSKPLKSNMNNVGENLYEFVIPKANKPRVSFAIAAWDKGGNKSFLKSNLGKNTIHVPVENKGGFFTSFKGVLITAGIVSSIIVGKIIYDNTPGTVDIEVEL
jgi:hypothetical protein